MKNKILLSKRNCHRASVVRNIHHPEWGDWAFHYKEQSLPGRWNYAHTIGTGCHSKVLHNIDSDMSEYEVISWKYDVTLDEFWDAAQRAFNWTSFDPETRGATTIKEHEEELNSDLKNIPNEEKERYILNYKKYFSAWLSAQSSCASSAITGGANFNVRRAEAANKRERSAMQEFIAFRERALKAIEKRKEEARPESEKRDDAWRRLRLDILESAATVHGINIGKIKGCAKPLFVSSIYGKVETFANRGDVEMTQKAIDCIRDFNEKYSIVITERHKFFKLVALAERIKEGREKLANKESQELEIKGGKVVYNYKEDRIQLIFDEKPSADIISQLKRAAFKWSHRFGAWQRQLTLNAESATRVFLKNNELFLNKQS